MASIWRECVVLLLYLISGKFYLATIPLPILPSVDNIYPTFKITDLVMQNTYLRLDKDWSYALFCSIIKCLELLTMIINFDRKSLFLDAVGNTLENKCKNTVKDKSIPGKRLIKLFRKKIALMDN